MKRIAMRFNFTIPNIFVLRADKLFTRRRHVYIYRYSYFNTKLKRKVMFELVSLLSVLSNPNINVK